MELPEDIGVDIKIEETGETFEENAVIKAIEYSKHYNGFVIATDGGIIIPALGTVWNSLQTRRFAGKKATDFERIKKLLELMKGKSGDKRKASWNEAIAIARKGRLLFSKQVEGIEGILQNDFDEKKYKEGIWLCSIWFFPQFGKNFFDLSKDEVDEVEISWRKLRNLTREFLKRLGVA